MTAIVAYHERASMDPKTGADGVLRDEWRLVPFREGDAEQDARLVEAFGPDWRRYRPFPKTILEHRYVRRGVEEPWLSVATANRVEEALGEIDPYATAVDQRLAAIQKGRADYAAEQAQAAREQREKDDAAMDRRRQRVASQDAFDRLLRSKDAEWAHAWNNTVRATATEDRRRLKEDAAFVRLHDAVIDAVTVPAKRKAIRAALAYLGQKEG